MRRFKSRQLAIVAGLTLILADACTEEPPTGPPVPLPPPRIGFGVQSITTAGGALHVVDPDQAIDSLLAAHRCIGRVYSFKFGEQGVASFGVGCPGIEIQPREGRPPYLILSQYRTDWINGTNDGSRLIFEAIDPTGGHHLFSVRYDGTDVRTIDQREMARNSSLSANGKLVSFVQCDSRGVCDIAVADFDARTVRTVLANTQLGQPVLSPDGQQMLLLNAGGTSVYRLALDGSGSAPVEIMRAPAGGAISAVHWLSNSRILAQQSGVELVFANSSGAQEARIAGGDFAGPSGISPNGQRIAYTVTQFTQVSEVYVANVDGSNARALTRTGQRAIRPFWTR